MAVVGILDPMQASRIGRRNFLRGLAAASGLTLLSGCGDLIEHIVDTCPTDTAGPGGIDWVPDVAHPVFWGFQDLTTADGAPRTMRIYYPSHAGTPQGAPILQMCLFRWPVVLFLHGQPPAGVSGTGYHRRWLRIPYVLARSGYVVVVPSYTAQPPSDDPEPITAAVNDIAFVRTAWTNSKWVDRLPEQTAVSGHSYGALLAARVAGAHREFGAYAGLSGPFPGEGVVDLLQQIRALVVSDVGPRQLHRPGGPRRATPVLGGADPAQVRGRVSGRPSWQRNGPDESGELTPTMKLKRRVIHDKHAADIDALYAGRRRTSPIYRFCTTG